MTLRHLAAGLLACALAAPALAQPKDPAPAAGVEAIVHELHHQKPHMKVLLLGVFPRSAKPGSGKDLKDVKHIPADELNTKLPEVNKRIAKLDDGGKTVKYLDIGSKFLDKD